MKKIYLIIVILILIVSTTITKNSTKEIDDKIYETKENLRLLKDNYEYVLLDYNYLSSPKKLMEYQSQFFESDLKPIKIENSRIITFKDKKLFIRNYLSK
tara:strand:+ start:2354 stop:2653 length:300 start_codon:yes stop_codon:yes gene_type:complete